jgi:hypothetical protein
MFLVIYVVNVTQTECNNSDKLRLILGNCPNRTKFEEVISQIINYGEETFDLMVPVQDFNPILLTSILKVYVYSLIGTATFIIALIAYSIQYLLTKKKRTVEARLIKLDRKLKVLVNNSK